MINHHFLRLNFFILLVFPWLLVNAGSPLLTGAERLDKYLPLLKDKRVGVVVNQTSVVGTNQEHLLDVLIKNKVNVTAAFAPEHGFRGTAEYGANVSDGKDIKTGIPIYSLHGKTKKPLPEQLNKTDVIVFDIQDVGARFYTYISTMFYVMEACAENDKEFIVLDRPNPCDYVDGPVLNRRYKSFVGMLQIPILHGCTVGELARLINGEGWLLGKPDICKLTVIPVEGWKHGQPYSLPIPPSPNLPNDQAIQLYASLCAFEATKISVGRGTTFPFQVIGAPNEKYGSFAFTPRSMPGFDSNPLHKDVKCYGLDLRNVTSVKGLTLKYVIEFYKKSGEDATFFSRRNWMDLLMGTNQVREAIVAGKTEEQIRAEWQTGLDEYKVMRRKYVLY
ncbi:exo-beta-N-acetylmuramidase NamZ domain-containing protein [Bacteroides sp. 519]|uniref:exo-beta-N-acetylmuramidase NamZ family protein n=1 Tax=Bacteroides sp. 519 TaxID=2302937 RepID=UPI0013D0ACD2|nr:DUF1343 domain-containing protein [Bacteroides sp. 519]NDV57766.1 DUF1343 domain-containing protein [Bacteroides sp. 519]